VWEWFIVTLVTHSSGVSSSGVSRGIHHKCKHPLNPTRLYVSGWVESESRVLFEKSEHVWMIYKMLGLCDGMLLFDELFYSSLPCLFVWLSCMWFFSLCDDHQFIDVSRCERCSPSTGKRRLRCLATWTGLVHYGLSFRATTHVFGCSLISQSYYC